MTTGPSSTSDAAPSASAAAVTQPALAAHPHSHAAPAPAVAAQTTPAAAQTPPAAPTRRAARALGPDVARGLMLLFIALANTTLYLYGVPDGALSKPLGGDLADRVVDAVTALVIDNRSFPLFAFLFAYGIHQLTAREQARGATWPQTRSLLLRRNAWLYAIGAVHAVLLFFGDIITTYAIAGLLLVALVRAPRGILWLVFWLTAPVLVLMTVGDTVSWTGFTPTADSAPVSVTATSALEGYLAQLGMGALVAVSAPFMALMILPPMMLGLLCARARLLEEPWRHARFAHIAAWGGIAIGVLGGLPLAIGFLAEWPASPMYVGWGLLHGATGLIAGPAFAIAIALIVSRAQRRLMNDPDARPGPIARALSALGRRSMSGYVAQSVLSIALFPAWTLGIGGVLSSASMALVAVGIWLVTLVGAVLLEAAGRPGPLEWLLRRLVYGRTPRREQQTTAIAEPGTAPLAATRRGGQRLYRHRAVRLPE